MIALQPAWAPAPARRFIDVHPDAGKRVDLPGGIVLHLGGDGLPHTVQVAAGRRAPHTGWLQMRIERLGYTVGRIGPWSAVWRQPQLQHAHVFPPARPVPTYRVLTEEDDKPVRYPLDRDPEPEPDDPWDETEHGPDIYDALQPGGLARGPRR